MQNMGTLSALLYNVPFNKYFCGIGIILYLYTCKRREFRLPKESAFSPYSEFVKLDTSQ